MEENDEYTSFMEFCKNLEGKTLKTLGGKTYFDVVQVKPNRLDYKISNGNLRTEYEDSIENILRKYAETSSLKHVDYKDITRNASYTLAILQLYKNRK